MPLEPNARDGCANLDIVRVRAVPLGSSATTKVSRKARISRR